MATRFHHVVAENSRLYRHSDLGRAGGLCTVANGARKDGYGVDKGVRDLVKTAAVQVGDAATATASRADRAAIGREASDAGFLMHRDQIGHRQGAQKRVLVHAPFAGIYDDGNRGGHTLIATSRNDANGQFAPVHAGIRARGGVGARTSR